jgi:hypothetical protein
MKNLMETLRSPGGMVAILGVICILVGPTIGTIAGSNATLAAVGGVILLAGYIIIAVGLVMIVLAVRRARRQAGPNKT